MFGKTHVVPRSVAWCGDPGTCYTYSGHDHRCDGWPQHLCEVRSNVERFVGCTFNFLLMNRYDDGNEYMGWHRDDELASRPLIASLSLGAHRRFRLECDSAFSAEPVVNIELNHGDLLVFDGSCRHTLPKTVKPVGCRINLTFRQIERHR